MADVTISSLPLGIPSGNVVIPYSDGSTTYTARPSAIVAASSGSVLQMQFVPYAQRYTYTASSTWQNIGAPLNITTKGVNSKIVLLNNISVLVYNNAGAACFSYTRNNTILTPDTPAGDNLGYSFGIVTRYSGALPWDNLSVNFVDTPNASVGTLLTYSLALRKASNYATEPTVALNDAGNNSLTHFMAMEIAA